MSSAAAGLYFRMWLTAFPSHPSTREYAERQFHYEQLHATSIDRLEQLLRRAMADPTRRLAEVTCDGRHHGAPVPCRYAGQAPLPRNDPPAPPI